MAVMIPEKPRDFEPASQEGLMFDALSSLPDDYFVFHSLRITTVSKNTIHESETDFVIFNKDKGIICLEAKAGQVHYEKGEWLYGSNIPMRHGGPFNQASLNKYKLMGYIEDSQMSGVINNCKFLHAVWFPAIDSLKLHSLKFPPEADKRLVLTKEALSDPEPFLDNIYTIEYTGKVQTRLSEIEAQQLINNVLCPQFNVFPSASFDSEMKKIVFHRLLNEQSGILNFLVEQRTAAINGAAGTGKTMIAVEKAQRNAAAGDAVLFLCYNSKLKEYLQDNYSNNNISYYTIAGFVCWLCKTMKPDYEKAQTILEDLYISGKFPYKHIIIDEGQDFGVDAIEETDLANMLLEIVTDQTIDGSFYVFYDRLQMIQADTMPSFIEELDCRLTLYKNCRNTENIALTSLRPISERIPELYEGSIKGVPAKIHFCSEDDIVQRVNSSIDTLVKDGLKDIVLLTCKTEDTSCLQNEICNGRYHNKYLFSTCRKYKGLEADAILLVDVDKRTFTEDKMMYYVGASRARIRLDVFAILSDDDCEYILKNELNYSKKISKAKKDFAGALNALGSLKQ